MILQDAQVNGRKTWSSSTKFTEDKMQISNIWDFLCVISPSSCISLSTEFLNSWIVMKLSSGLSTICADVTKLHEVKFSNMDKQPCNVCTLSQSSTMLHKQTRVSVYLPSSFQPLPVIHSETVSCVYILKVI